MANIDRALLSDIKKANRCKYLLRSGQFRLKINCLFYNINNKNCNINSNSSLTPGQSFHIGCTSSWDPQY